jgi:hypothetical protein
MIALGKAALVCLLAYAVLVLAMYLRQRSLQYHPEAKGLTPEAVGLSGVEVNLVNTPDGERIVTWYTPAKPDRPTIIYFHGNAGEIGDRPLRYQYYATRGFGVLYVSYRGFGGSTGQISERGLVTDAIASYDWLINRGVAPGKIALLGESLGTGVAIQLAAQRPVGAVALEAPYTSTADIAGAIYWWLPVRLLMKDQFRSVDHVGAVKAPLLIVHGDADTLIPVKYGKALFAAASEPKEIAIATGFGHEVLFEEATWARELDFFVRVIK